MIQALDYSKYSGFFILSLRQRFTLQRLIDAPYLIPDTHLPQLQTWLSQPEVSCIQSYIRPSFQDVHPPSLVAIGLPAYGFCHLAITLTTQ